MNNEDHLQAGIFGKLAKVDELMKANETRDLSKLSVNKVRFNIEYADAPLRISVINQRVGKICVAKDVLASTDSKNILVMQELQKQAEYLKYLFENLSKLIIKERGIDDFIIKHSLDVNEAIEDLDNDESGALKRIRHLSTSNESIISAIEFIDGNLDKRLTLDQVSGKVYLSDYYFSKLFKRETGLSFSVYLNARKIQKAMILLKESNKSVNEISSALGFTRLSYFSQTLKKYTGYAPTKYRIDGKD